MPILLKSDSIFINLIIVIYYIYLVIIYSQTPKILKIKIMKKTIFVALALSVLIVSACKKERTCNCSTSTSTNQDYTGTIVNGNPSNQTKDTSYTNNGSTVATSFRGASKANISANKSCNNETITSNSILIANSASSSSVNETQDNLPPGKVKVGTVVQTITTTCTLDKK
jgi:hypothetical protein